MFLYVIVGKKYDIFRVENFVFISKVSRENSACALLVIRAFEQCMLGKKPSFTIVTQESERKSLSEDFEVFFSVKIEIKAPITQQER